MCSTLCVYGSCPPLAIWYLCSGPQCAIHNSNPFYHLVYPDTTHVRLRTRLSLLFHTASDEKMGGGLANLRWVTSVVGPWPIPPTFYPQSSNKACMNTCVAVHEYCRGVNPHHVNISKVHPMNMNTAKVPPLFGTNIQ